MFLNEEAGLNRQQLPGQPTSSLSSWLLRQTQAVAGDTWRQVRLGVLDLNSHPASKELAKNPPLCAASVVELVIAMSGYFRRCDNVSGTLLTINQGVSEFHNDL